MTRKIWLSKMTTTNLSVFSFLKGIDILEHDINNETLCVWSFPSITDAKKSFVLQKFTDLLEKNSFVCCQFQSEWCYITNISVSDALPTIRKFGIVIWASEFSPKKYNALCRILGNEYVKSGDPAALLQIYLMVMTTGMCSSKDNGTLLMKELDDRSENDFNSELTDIINTFGLETILIYTALLLNKRIFIYDHNLSSLQQTVETLPRFMTIRNFKNCIFPWIHLNVDEITDLKRKSVYIAGSTDNSITTRTDLYDVLINVAAREVAVAPHARDSFLMTKTHKDIALFLVQLAESKNQNIAVKVARKTQDLLTQLRSLATTETGGQKMISMESLKEKQYPPSLENFLFNLAVAENIMLL